MKKTSEAIKNRMEKTTGKLVIAVMLTLALTGCAPNEKDATAATEFQAKAATIQEVEEYLIVGEGTVGQNAGKIVVMVKRGGTVEPIYLGEAKIEDDVKALTGSCLQVNVNGESTDDMVVKICKGS